MPNKLSWIFFMPAIALIVFEMLSIGESDIGSEQSVNSESSCTDSPFSEQAQTSSTIQAQEDPVDNTPQEQERIEPSGMVATDEKTTLSKDRSAILHGSLLLPDGAPAEGVSLRLSGWEGNDARVRIYGRPESWDNLTAFTDEAGQFEFRFDPPLAYQFSLDTQLDGYANVSWRWYGFRPRQDINVGTVELCKSGTILARVKDIQGEVLKTGWLINADSGHYKLKGGDHDHTRVYAEPDPETGIARLENLPPGPAKIRARSPMSGWIPGPCVDVIPDQIVHAEINYNGPDNARRITVILHVEPFGFPRTEEGSVLLSNNGVDWIPSKQVPGFACHYSFDDLSPGSYTVKIEDPRYKPWKEENVKPGEEVNAHVYCNGALEVSVFDAVSGEAVDGYRVLLRGVSALIGDSRTVYGGMPKLLVPNSEGAYTGIPPLMKCDLIVDAKGYARKHVLIDHDQLEPGETRSVEAYLEYGAELRGRVVMWNGKTPAAGVHVHLENHGIPLEFAYPKDAEELDRDPVVLEMAYPQEADQACKFVVATGESGTFSISRVPAGNWSLHAYPNPWILDSIDPLPVKAGEVKDNLLLQLPPTSTLKGRLVISPGFSFDTMKLKVKHSAPELMEAFSYLDGIQDVALSDDGRFESCFLPVGKATLVIRCGPFSYRYGYSKVERFDWVLESGLKDMGDLEIKDPKPGSLRVLATRDGVPLANHVVEIHALDIQAQTRAVTGVDGTAVFDSLFPGKWTVAVQQADDDGWRYLYPFPVEALPHNKNLCKVKVRLIKGKVRILNVFDREPLADHQITLVFPDKRATTRKTDEQGWLELSLGPGSYILRTLVQLNNHKQFMQEANLDWTLAGPAQDTVQLNMPWKPWK